MREIHLRVQILIALKRYEQADDVLRLKIGKFSDFSLIKLRVEVLKHIKDPRRILSVTGVGLSVSTNKDHGFLFFHRANALYDTKKYDEEITYYNLALAHYKMSNSRMADIYYNRYQDMLSLRKAQEHLEEVKKEQDRNARDSESDSKPKVLKRINNL